MSLRGIRGAITVSQNSKEAIFEASRELLQDMMKANTIQVEDVCSIFFSVTPDLNQDFPARSARELGFQWTPLLCLSEIPVEGAMERCIRILLHVNTDKSQKEMRHCYLREAKLLRPDLAYKEEQT